MDTWQQTVRKLERHAGFSALTVVTLALAIAAVVTVLALVRGVLLRQLPYPEASRVIEVDHAAPGFEMERIGISAPLYLAYRQYTDLFEELGLYNAGELTLTGESGPMRVGAARVTPSLFRVLGVAAESGRTFTEDEGQLGGAPVVVLSQRLWRGRYGGDEAILGRQVRIDGVLREVVGVMPASFEFPTPEAELWLPLVVDPNHVRMGNFTDNAVARLRAGADLASVHARLEALTTDLVGNFPADASARVIQDAGLRPFLTTRLERVVGGVRPILWLLLAAVGLILVIAGANVANLFLVRAEERSGELAVRSAFGASRPRLLGLLLAEAAWLGLATAAAAAALAAWTLALVVKLGPASVPRLQEVRLDSTALALTLVLALVSTLGAALVPALRATRGDLAGSLGEGLRTSAGRDRQRLRAALVVVQVALGVVLLVACGLVARSVLALQRVDPGFRPAGALTFELALPEAEYPQAEDRARFVEQLRERLAALPGVSAVGAAGYLPLSDQLDGSGYALEEAPSSGDSSPLVLLDTKVSPGYLEAMGIPLIAGRLPEPDDSRLRRGSIVISASIARRFWPGQSALGKRTKIGDRQRSSWYTVVGVAGDVRLSGLDQEPDDMVYLPLLGGPEGTQDLGPAVSFVLRTELPPESLSARLRTEVASLDPNLPLARVRPLAELVRASRAARSFAVTVLLLAALMALVIATVGLYGVIAYVISRRTRELGIRMALGADRRRIGRLVLGQGLRLAALGVIAGVVLALSLTQLLESLLFGVSARDPLTFVLVSLGLLGVALLAAGWPAWQATRIAPIEALRHG